MGKSKTKRKTKKRKQDSMIRTDVWELKVTSGEKKLLLLTVAEYRRFLKPLVFIVNAEWKLIGNLTDKEKINYLEKSIHVTSKNPQIKYLYYQKVINKYPSFKKATFWRGTGLIKGRMRFAPQPLMNCGQ